MKQFKGKTLSWRLEEKVLKLELHHQPCNEIGRAMLEELELFVASMQELTDEAEALLFYSSCSPGFSAGADLRELFAGMLEVELSERISQVREFLHRIHAVMNAIDSWPRPTVAAIHGVCFGGGLELALVADLRVADKMARFCFPELRLGLIPGFGGIPRLKRDIGNGMIRDLLLTGRSLNAARAQAVGLVNQLAGEGQALVVAQSMVTQIGKFDCETAASAKEFIKPIPYDELQREIDVFCELLSRPAVEAGLRKFVESTDAHPYLP